jgi:hypothetical protein
MRYRRPACICAIATRPLQAVLVGGYGGSWLPLPSAAGKRRPRESQLNDSRTKPLGGHPVA